MCSNKCNYLNSTFFDCDQLDDYCGQYKHYSSNDVVVNTVINTSMGVCGIVGFIGYICMAGTLTKMKLDVASSIYYQSMVIMELVHMVIMTEAGIIRLQPSMNTDYSVAYWGKKMGSGWFLGNSMKLSVMILATFLSTSSACAIMAPIFYRKCNKAWVAVMMTSVALAYGSLVHVPEVFLGKLVSAPSGWIVQPGPYDAMPWMTASITAQYVSKLVFSVCLLGLSCAIVIGLIYKSKHAKTLTGRDSEHWKTTNRLTALSLIVGTSTLVDNVCWIAYRNVSVHNMPLLGADAINSLTYEDSLSLLNFQYIVAGTRLAQVFTGELVHAGRFYLYMAFNKPFRRGFTNFICAKTTTTVSFSSKP